MNTTCARGDRSCNCISENVHQNYSWDPKPSDPKPGLEIVRVKHRVVPFHLTSHITGEFPCICNYVFDRLEEVGFTPEQMDYKEVTLEYQKLQSKNPHLKRLYVI